MAEDMVAEDMAAATLRTFMAATLSHTAELTSEYMSEYIPASEYMRALAYAAELAWVAATTAASGTALDVVGTAVAGGLTASAVAGDPLPSATFGYVVENKIYNGRFQTRVTRL